jgi:fatty acid-binding protein DegV
MARIAVVTDSVACLPPELVEAYGIRIVPVRIILGERIFRDGIDVTAEEVYAWQRAGIMPTSSQPSVGDFLETYRGAGPAGGGDRLHSCFGGDDRHV